MSKPPNKPHPISERMEYAPGSIVFEDSEGKDAMPNELKPVGPAKPSRAGLHRALDQVMDKVMNAKPAKGGGPRGTSD